MNVKATSHERGIAAEKAAEIFLRAKGYEILERRYKTPVGEIDIIALDDDYVVFIEVKARAAIDDALYSITPRMRARINDAASYYIMLNPDKAGMAMRFDVMAVQLPFRIQHMENAFME
ncbi:MAG: YraN family protein [Micavibrio sp.]